MAETWLPWCERIDGPPWKQGYPGIPNRTLNDIEGEVKHSAEGPFSALLAEINNATRTASWTFAIREDGHTVQHYPLEAITWHCGVKGDLDTITELIGNVTLMGEEFAGSAGTPLTPSQNNSSLRISRDVRQLTPTGLRPAELEVNLWEHGWISWTTCPSDRVDWPLHLAALNIEETELPQEIIVVGRKGGGGLFTLEGQYITPARWQALQDIAARAGLPSPRVVELPSDHIFFKSGQIVYPQGDIT